MRGKAETPQVGGGKSDRGEISIQSVLGKGSSFEGNLTVEGSIRVDGNFEGTLHAKETLVVGKTGRVKADVRVAEATVAGTVEGNLVASRRVELEAGARLVGEIESASLIIHEGVFFEGSCRMSGQGDQRKVPAPPKPQTEMAEKEQARSPRM